MVNITSYLDHFFKFIKMSDVGISNDDLEKIWGNEYKRKKIMINAEKINIVSATLVKNQEKYIVESIKSSDKIADEIHIFDTGSDDKTLDVVKEIKKRNKKVQLHEIPWTDDFAYMRNKVNRFLPSDCWVFCIDSDEEMTLDFDANLLKLFLSMIEYLHSKSDISLCFKQTGGVSLVAGYPERLYKKSETLSFFGCVHEELRSAKDLIRIKTQFTLLNKGRLEEEKQRFNKEKKYYKLLLKNIELEPDNEKWIALLPFNEGMKNKAFYIGKLELFIAILKEKVVLESFFYETIVVNYAKALMQTKKLDEATELLSYFKKVYPLNMSIILLYYFLINLSIQSTARNVLLELEKDASVLKSKDDRWNEYNNVVGLDGIKAKLLFKAEEYDLVLALILPHVKDSNDGLLIAELAFIKKILNQSSID